MTSQASLLGRLRGYVSAIACSDDLGLAALSDDLVAAVSEIERLRASEAELEKLVYVPGAWRCAKCDFRLLQSNLNMMDGTVTSRDDPGDKCPNDGAPLRRVTYREDVADAYERWEAQVQKATAIKTAIAAMLREGAAEADSHGLSYDAEVLEKAAGWVERIGARP